MAKHQDSVPVPVASIFAVLQIIGIALMPDEPRYLAMASCILVYLAHLHCLRGCDCSKDNSPALLESLLDPVLKTRNETIVEVNEAALHMFGYNSSDLIGQHVSVLLDSWVAHMNALLVPSSPRGGLS